MITQRKVKIYKFKQDDINKCVARIDKNEHTVLEVKELVSYKELIDGKDKKEAEEKAIAKGKEIKEKENVKPK